MGRMKSGALVLVFCFAIVCSSFGREYDERGFRTKGLRHHRRSENGHLSALSSNSDISFTSSTGGDNLGTFGADFTSAGEQGAKLAEEGLSSIKEGGDQVKENVEAAAKAFIDAFLQTFKEGVADLKLALDDHYSRNGGNVKFNFKHTSENNNDGKWKTNTIQCTSGLGSEPLAGAGGIDDSYFPKEDEFSVRSRPRSKLGSSRPRLSFDIDDEIGKLGKGKFSFRTVEEEETASSSGKGKLSFSSDSNHGHSGGATTSAAAGKGKFSYAVGGGSDFSERSGRIDDDFAAKSRIDEEETKTESKVKIRLGATAKSSANSAKANSGSYSGGADSDSSAEFGVGISGKSSADDSDSGVGFTFGSGSGNEGQGSAKFSFGGGGGTGSSGSTRFSLGRLRRGRPISRIDYAIQDERPWRDYVLKTVPQSPHTHSYEVRHSIAPTYVNYPHN